MRQRPGNATHTSYPSNRSPKRDGRPLTGHSTSAEGLREFLKCYASRNARAGRPVTHAAMLSARIRGILVPCDSRNGLVRQRMADHGLLWFRLSHSELPCTMYVYTLKTRRAGRGGSEWQ